MPTFFIQKITYFLYKNSPTFWYKKITSRKNIDNLLMLEIAKFFCTKKITFRRNQLFFMCMSTKKQMSIFLYVNLQNFLRKKIARSYIQFWIAQIGQKRKKISSKLKFQKLRNFHLNLTVSIISPCYQNFIKWNLIISTTLEPSSFKCFRIIRYF